MRYVAILFIVLLAFAPNAASAQAGRHVISSGPKNSGEFDGWSQWYEFCTDPLPDGFRVMNFEYHLDGDRHCGAWAECAPGTDTPQRKCVRFRMQGHNEGRILGGPAIFNPNNGQRESTMTIDYLVVQDTPPAPPRSNSVSAGSGRRIAADNTCSFPLSIAVRWRANASSPYATARWTIRDKSGVTPLSYGGSVIRSSVGPVYWHASGGGFVWQGTAVDNANSLAVGDKVVAMLALQLPPAGQDFVIAPDCTLRPRQ